MMRRIRKAQNSWLAKSILFLTALSFMSLFGISGYVGSAGKNQPVIKVDGLEVLQSNFAEQLEKQANMAKSMLGENFGDDIKINIVQQLVAKNLTELILDRTTDKLNMSISDDLIRRDVFSRGEFMDENGDFNINNMRRTLKLYGISEGEFIAETKTSLERQHLLNNPVDNTNIPDIMAQYLAKSKNQKKVFKYIKLDVDKTKVERKMSDEEAEQYYQDFISEFTEPEARDVDFIVISNAEISKNINPSDEEITAFYNENITKFETPEMRRVLQMVLANEEEAIDAKANLDKGDDFYKVAKMSANQTTEDTDFGFVSKDMLVDEISTVAFSAPKNKISGPIQSDFGWHIFKVIDTKPATKVNFAKAKAEIIEDIRRERVYEAFQGVVKDIDDKVGAGTTIEELAKHLNAKIHHLFNFSENQYTTSSNQFTSLIKGGEFYNVAFSYNVDEISQVFETDDGLVLLVVKKIVDAKPKDIKLVRGEIEKIWSENERGAIVQEIINNVTYDLESGDSMEDVAKRFSLNLKTTSPIKRSDSFESLNENTIFQLFQEPYNSPKTIDLGNSKIIAMSVKTKTNKSLATEQEVRTEKAILKLDLQKEYSQYLIDSFARDYKIKIDYKLIGLGE